MTSTSPDAPSVLLAVDWNNTASAGGINEAILNAHGGNYSVVKDLFEADWQAGGWQRFAPKVPFREGKDVNTERGALKRWARMNYLFDMQLRGHPAAPAISVEEMYEFGKQVEVFEGFDTLMQELKDHVFRETGKRLWISVVTNAWGPVIRGTDIVRSGIVDQVVAQEFLRYVTPDGRILAIPSGGVGEETKPLALRYLAAQKSFPPLKGPTPVGARVLPPAYGVPQTIPDEATVAVGNGFSDQNMIEYVARRGGVMFGVVNADFIYPKPGLYDNPMVLAKTRTNAYQDDCILQDAYDNNKLTVKLVGDYRETTAEGQRTRAIFRRGVELAATINTPDVAHELLRAEIKNGRLGGRAAAMDQPRSIGDNFGEIAS